MDQRRVDTACALEIVVHPDHYGRGLFEIVLARLRRSAASHGLDTLLAPVRPPGKAAEPAVPMVEYAARRRPDGLPADRWLRVHVRAGGELIGVAPCSATVQAPLQRWREWTGLPFDRDGETHVPGGLGPVLVSTAHNIGVYIEPNMWVLHRC